MGGHQIYKMLLACGRNLNFHLAVYVQVSKSVIAIARTAHRLATDAITFLTLSPDSSAQLCTLPHLRC